MDHESEFDQETYEGLTGRDAAIFLIDASAPMFKADVADEEADEPANCPFMLALNCAHNTLCSKILTAEHDSVGIVLFGTKKTGSSEKYGLYTNTNVLLDLQKPDCGPIVELETILNEGVEEFENSVTDPPALALAEALWLCTSMFSKQYVVSAANISIIVL